MRCMVLDIAFHLGHEVIITGQAYVTDNNTGYMKCLQCPTDHWEVPAGHSIDRLIIQTMSLKLDPGREPEATLASIPSGWVAAST